MDRLVVQIDVPGPQEALEELERGGIDAVIAAWNLGNGTQGWELAAKLRNIDEKVNIMILGDYNDTELDDEMREQSPFVYMGRPFDIPQLINVLKAILDAEFVFVQQKDGDFVVHDVTVGDSAMDDVLLLSGVSEGEQVVSKGGFTLKSLLLKSTLAEDE